MVFGGKDEVFRERVQPFAEGLFLFLAVFGGAFFEVFEGGEAASLFLKTGGDKA